jgi:TetR/AcrR family fatty acid metabolism transcriptional regulator
MAKQRDDEGMKSRLMEAAMNAFTKKGLNGCTMANIAQEAGLASGTAYLYFKGKEQLMVTMYKLYSSRMLDYQRRLLAKMEGKTARELLTKMCEECLRAAIRHRATFGLWFQFLALSSTPNLRTDIKKILADNYRGHNDYIEALLKQGIQNREFKPDINTRAISASLIALLEGFLIREYADSDLINLEKDYLQMVDTVLDGISISS